MTTHNNNNNNNKNPPSKLVPFTLSLPTQWLFDPGPGILAVLEGPLATHGLKVKVLCVGWRGLVQRVSPTLQKTNPRHKALVVRSK